MTPSPATLHRSRAMPSTLRTFTRVPWAINRGTTGAVIIQTSPFQFRRDDWQPRTAEKVSETCAITDSKDGMDSSDFFLNQALHGSFAGLAHGRLQAVAGHAQVIHPPSALRHPKIDGISLKVMRTYGIPVQKMSWECFDDARGPGLAKPSNPSRYRKRLPQLVAIPVS